MKFVDSVSIMVIAGKGGDGCISFNKQGKNNFFGKPDGSNGGNGGNVWLLADSNIKSLIHFNYKRIFKAGNGCTGRSRNCTGKSGKDMVIKVPLGTRVRCKRTHVLLGDMINYKNNPLLVAKGGVRGLGNNSFRYTAIYKNKNRNFMQCKVRGSVGESRNLLLDLFLIADVGVFGLPNSGKSSFVRLISRADLKVADYPFTTLNPQLGAVNMNDCGNNRFIIADIPGIIKGASSGLGLGIQFLKHLKRCRMLLHFVDINPVDNSDPSENIISIERELSNYDSELIRKTRWLIFNKIDLLNKLELVKRMHAILKSVQWNDRYYAISVAYNINISSLCRDIMCFINRKIEGIMK